MGKLISSINVTSDGFCSHTDALIDEEHHRFSINLLKQADLLLFGRVTYQLFEDYWPSAAKNSSLPESVIELAQLIDHIKKAVASETLSKTSWNNPAVLREITADSIHSLKKTNNNVLIFGSPGLLSELSKQGLVDEYYFTIQPMLAGKGPRIFQTITLQQRVNLKYLETIPFASGVITLHYAKEN